MSSELAHEAVLTAFKTMSDAWALMDAARLAACYASEATVIGPGVFLRGRNDINVGMAAAFAGPLKHSVRPHSVQSVRFLSGDAAVVVTESATVFAGEAEAPPDRRHLVTWILACHDGWWLVEANHFCQA
ncbi:MAG TPA: SgcJ/EcaC family oxidoreductase [Streptosporangiaceae bacterium]|nr:SgcJ/EcaC family oxidoreductase [Streptosporangiaceae bacterium]